MLYKSFSAIRLALLSAAMLPVVTSCSMLPGARHAEPRHVAVMNHTGVDLYNVSVREVPKDDAQPVRLGSVSPLMAGHSYAVQRRPNPRPLTPVIRVEWELRNGRTMSTVVTIDEVMRRATGAENEALVFAIQPSASVGVFLAPVEDFDR